MLLKDIKDKIPFPNNKIKYIHLLDHLEQEKVTEPKW